MVPGKRASHWKGEAKSCFPRGVYSIAEEGVLLTEQFQGPSSRKKKELRRKPNVEEKLTFTLREALADATITSSRRKTSEGRAAGPRKFRHNFACATRGRIRRGKYLSVKKKHPVEHYA